MKIRTLKRDEYFEAGRISMICFHSVVEDPEAKRAECERCRDEQWGAFDEDGTLMGSIINNHFTAYLQGKPVSSGGIGAVSTLPEYREGGVIRQIFARLLPAGRERGEVISCLYPFSHAFYRKFGYETACRANLWRIPADGLRGFHHTGWVRQWRPGQATEAFTRIYDRFAARLNLSLVRSDEMMKEAHVRGDYWKDLRFCYLLGEGDREYAYVLFTCKKDGEARLQVNECAWTCPEGLRAVLGFLSRFTADYSEIILCLPTGVDLMHMLNDPYNVSCRARVDYMVRVMNTEKLLALLCENSAASFSLRVVGDEQISENNGTFRVERGEVLRITDPEADLMLSLRALGLLCTGAEGLQGLLNRPDVTLNGNREALQAVFGKRSCYVGDHF